MILRIASLSTTHAPAQACTFTETVDFTERKQMLAVAALVSVHVRLAQVDIVLK